MKKKISCSAESSNSVLHTSLDGCNDKPLAALDLICVVALCIQHIAAKLEVIQRRSVLDAAGELTELDKFPLTLLNAVRIMALCPSCNSVTPLSFFKGYGIKNAAIAYLMNKGKISRTNVDVPSVEEIVETIHAEGILLEFKLECNHCDCLEFYLISELHKFGTIAVPKLTK